jgi:hypothetical protein
MLKKLLTLLILFLLISWNVLLPQARSAFSGDLAKFTQELKTYLGPNLSSEQQTNLNRFITNWDSAAFNRQLALRILDISSQLSSRSVRPVPHFYDFILTINSFVDNRRETESFSSWLDGLTELAFDKKISNENIDRFFKITGAMIKNNVLYESGSVRWKVKTNTLKFLHDTTFFVSVSNATLTCYSHNDSTEIYNASGSYYPENMLFVGTKGTITWEKAGFPSKDVFAQFGKYIINLSRSSFRIDSAWLTYKTYFTSPVEGFLTDQAISPANKETVTFPRFETYAKKFGIKNLFEGVDYKGGLSFEGASVKGKGENFIPATIMLYRNDTLYLNIRSKEFIFSKTGLTSQEAAVSLYLDRDSIYHSNLGFSYLAPLRQVNLYRTNNPVSRSPYFNSFHSLDMYFEYLSWNMNESKIIFTRPKGAALGQAQFESSSSFNSDYFIRLMGLDDYHPLNRLVAFAAYYYSDTFPVAEFAKWLKKPIEIVTGLCIDMANQGFVFYDRGNNEVTIKKKTRDFLDFFSRKKDYDVLNIKSETKTPADNAVLDLRNIKLTVNGVSKVSLSDSQKVAIYPYKQQLVIGKGRNIEFDGMVEAGLFKIYGHNFFFSYDTFKIRLQKLDSLKLAVETGLRDRSGRMLYMKIDNMIQMGTSDLYIDDPNNKSGLRSLKQYPLLNSIGYSYIFFDKIPGLEDIYSQKDFYFKIDPFNYENIDHFKTEDLNLSGEFVGGNILKPVRQHLTIQQDNSMGFNMIIPGDGIEIYGDGSRFYNLINMSNRGLRGSGTLKHLTSVTKSEEFKFFPDSMITQASTFNIEKDGGGIYPVLSSQDVAIRWKTRKDSMLAANATGKMFNMFENGTTLDGSVVLSTPGLKGSGKIDMPDSRINSEYFSFTSNSIKADTAEYNLKSSSTSGYSFIAENVNTDIDFDMKVAHFHLNTDTSVVKFPEIQYICTMTDFAYDMKTRILEMEQKGKLNAPLLTKDELLRVNYAGLSKPTFFATNNISDTVAFSSWKGSYHLDQEYIEAENINYIHVADALIQPENGKITINRRAKIKQLQNAIVAINKKHILHSAKIDIESTKRYTGSAVYDYSDENNEVQQISFPELSVDTLTTTAKGYISSGQKFMLSPAFSFAGDVFLSARANFLTFTGSAGISHNCRQLRSNSIKFKSAIDPANVMIPVSEKPRDMNDNLVFSGSFINIDSSLIYPAFLSEQKSWSDVAIVNANGYLYYEKAKERYLIASREKLVDQSLPGNIISFDRNACNMTGDGTLNFGTKFDLVSLAGAGRVNHSIDSGNVSLQGILAFDFYFSPEALKMMADQIKLTPTLKPVNLNSALVSRGMKDLLGDALATQVKEEMDLFGTSRSFPKEFVYELLLNDVNLYWNKATSSFRSKGKIGIGFVGTQPVNAYVDGFIEIQRRRSGDMFDIYLKASESTWYYFSYVRGVMMSQAGDNKYNTLIANIKLNARKHPDSSVRVPYTYMISVEDRLSRFLRRMSADNPEETPAVR